MTYRGTVRGGLVVLDGGAQLPEGTPVSVQPLVVDADKAGEEELLAMSKLASDTGIPDLAANIDHYLYGHPKVGHAE